MSDTFPLLLKEGKLFYAVISSPKLRLTTFGDGGEMIMSSAKHDY
jgi:hypothetical protein